MRDLLDRLKLERRIALTLFTLALLCIGALQLLAPETADKETPDPQPSARALE